MPSEAIAGGAGLAGGIIGNIEAGGSQDQATADMQAALNAIQGVNVPGIAEQQWNLTHETSAGQLSPQAMAAIGMGPNAMAGISTNPAYSQAQMAALQQLGQLGQGGLTAQERANLISANQQAAGQAQSANAATLQAMNARGMGGSGAQLAAQLSNGQAAANLASQQGAGINAQAQNQALQALAQQGGLAGSMQAQQFGQQAATAQAQNAINQFNAMNQQNVAGYNTQAANQAQATNLANSQALANQNVGLTNQQMAHNTGLYQQQFADQMQKAQALAGEEQANAGYQQGMANQTRQMWSGLGSSAGDMFSGMGGFGGGSSGGSSGGGGGGTNFNQDWGNAPSQNINPNAANGDWAALARGGMAGVDGYAAGGEVGYSGSNKDSNPGGSSASYQPTYAEGGEVPHDKQNLEQLKNAFNKFLKEEGTQNYDHGGEVSTLGSYSYADGGMVNTAMKYAPLAMMMLNKGGDIPCYSGGGGAGGGAGAGGAGAGASGGAAGAAAAGAMGGHGGGHGGHGALGLGGGRPYKKQGYADGGSIAPNPYSPGVSPEQNDGMHSVMQGGGTTQKDSRDQSSSLYNPNNMPPMSSDMRALVDAKLAAMAPGKPGVPLPTAQPMAALPISPPQDNPKDNVHAVMREYLKGIQPPKEKKMSNGGEAQWDFRSGGNVPGKAPVAGDSPKNDIVDAKLSPGEIVVKRSVAQSGDEEKILNFIKDVLAKKR